VLHISIKYQSYHNDRICMFVREERLLLYFLYDEMCNCVLVWIIVYMCYLC